MPRIKAGSIEEHKALTRRRILDATQVLLADLGHGDFGLAEVAAEAGIGRTTLYEYFRHRDDLIASLVEEAMPQVVDDLLAGLQGEPNDRLAELSRRMVRWVATDPVLGLILHREVPRLSAPAQDRIRRSHTDLVTEFAAIYRAGAACGDFRSIAPDLAGRLIQDAIMSAARLLLATPSPLTRVEEVSQTVARFLVNGLAPDASQTLT